ncbi:hypothetical protein AGMMS49579_10190 [Spirochaetia bacterium]|nr:hypothetical protein AGMMS49579_10190 [Spirochaetia bacterium]
MKPWLLWIIPPLAGAIIGYITNVVAIRMLFRPLKAIRVCGVRLPFTPGILPRQRHQLAESIGRMVERELLTPEIIRERLGREDVQEKLKAQIALYTGGLLAAPLEKILHPQTGGGSGVSGLILSFIRDFFYSENFDRLFDSLLRSLLESPGAKKLLDRSPAEIFGGGDKEALRVKLETFILNQLETTHIADELTGPVKKIYPQAAAYFIRFLSRSDIHNELEIQGRVFLSNAILKLNVFQRFFISAGQYDRTLQERMPEIIDDLIHQLDELFKDDAIRDQIVAAGIGAVKNAASAENSAALARFISTLIVGYADMPLGEVLQKFGAGDLAEKGRNLLLAIRKSFAPGAALTADAVVNGTPFPGTGLLAAAAEALPPELRQVGAGEFFSIGPEKKDALDTIITGKILGLADEQIGAALAGINVRTLVSERIDSLDMLKVEGIVLDVMANQLKWIDIFGAILGFGIGMFQALLGWALR